jgi:hypothetical protein
MSHGPLFLAWAAGFFDGEGSVFVEIAKNKNTRRGIRNLLTASVTQTSTPCLNLFKKYFGGSIASITPNRRQHMNNSVCYMWRVRSKDALAFLEAIAPYVVVKKEQVELALQYPLTSADGRKYAGHYNPLPNEVHNRRMEIGQKLRDIRASMKTASVVREDVSA